MFLFFVNLYRSFFLGTWQPFDSVNAYLNDMQPIFNGLGQFITSIFGDDTYNNLGEILFYTPNRLPSLIATILSLITTIGIVVMAGKGIKRVFGVFFMGIRK